MAYYLAIQNTYTHVQMALYENANELTCMEIDKTRASKDCIVVLQEMLTLHKITLNNLEFIAANQGPGPFTTLRVVIATINGLSFSSKIPLIGINAIEAFLQEYQLTDYHNKVVLMNAFGNDAYYGIQINNSYEDSGCGQIESILLQVTQKIPDGNILLLGNGVELFGSQITSSLEQRAVFLDPNPQTVSLKHIAQIGLQRWQTQKDITFQLQPLYFKSAFVAK